MKTLYIHSLKKKGPSSNQQSSFKPRNSISLIQLTLLSWPIAKWVYGELSNFCFVHPWKLTWNQNITQLKSKIIFQVSYPLLCSKLIFRGVTIVSMNQPIVRRTIEFFDAKPLNWCETVPLVFLEIPTTFKSENTTSFKSNSQTMSLVPGKFTSEFPVCKLRIAPKLWLKRIICVGSTRSLDATNLWGRKAGLANQHGVPTWGWYPSNLRTGSLRASLSWDPSEWKTSGAAAKNAPLVLCNGALKIVKSNISPVDWLLPAVLKAQRKSLKTMNLMYSNGRFLLPIQHRNCPYHVTSAAVQHIFGTSNKNNSLGILAHRTSNDEQLGCIITEMKRKVFI